MISSGCAKISTCKHHGKKTYSLLALAFSFMLPIVQLQAQVYLVGYGKADITYSKNNLGLFGFGNYQHRIADGDNGFTSRIYSRVISIKDPVTNKQIIYLHADLGAIFLPIRNGLIAKIKENLYPDFDEASLLMSASHTHCAPSGMSHYALYMMSAPGYNPELVEFTVSKMYESILQAIQSQAPSAILFKEGIFEPEIPVAFNRALKSYNKNADVKKKYKRTETNLAINRTMPMLSFADTSGSAKGFINWFGVHPIEVLSDHRYINGASKGYAASYAEENMAPGVVAIFAQSSAGDVMTSDIHNSKSFDVMMKRLLHDSTYTHDATSLKQSQWNGKMQADKALLIHHSKDSFKIQGGLDYEMIFVDLANIKVDEEYANGNTRARTSSACLGVPFFLPSFSWNDHSFKRSALKFNAQVSKLITGNRTVFANKEERLYRKELKRSQSPKKIVIDGAKKTMLLVRLENYHKRWFSTFLMNRIARKDILIKESIRQLDSAALKEHTLLPQILPIQIIRIGNVAIAGIPTELTTMAYNRLQSTIFNALKNSGIKKVLISSYANEYAGYTTTYEEYMVQRYEGGHTLFGKYQLGAFQTEFKKLASEFFKPKAERIVHRMVVPPVFSEAELKKRSHLIPLKK